MTGAPVCFRNCDRVTDMIGMAMRQHDMGDALDRRVPIRGEGRVAGEERIDEHGLAGEIEPESGMAEPGDLHGIKLTSDR